jgi:hypothetical protein
MHMQLLQRQARQKQERAQPFMRSFAHWGGSRLLVVAGGASTRRARPHPLPPGYPLAVAMGGVSGSGSGSGKGLSNGNDGAGFTLSAKTGTWLTVPARIAAVGHRHRGLPPLLWARESAS